MRPWLGTFINIRICLPALLEALKVLTICHIDIRMKINRRRLGSMRWSLMATACSVILALTTAGCSSNEACQAYSSGINLTFSLPGVPRQNVTIDWCIDAVCSQLQTELIGSTFLADDHLKGGSTTKVTIRIVSSQNQEIFNGSSALVVAEREGSCGSGTYTGSLIADGSGLHH